MKQKNQNRPQGNVLLLAFAKQRKRRVYTQVLQGKSSRRQTTDSIQSFTQRTKHISPHFQKMKQLNKDQDHSHIIWGTVRVEIWDYEPGTEGCILIVFYYVFHHRTFTLNLKRQCVFHHRLIFPYQLELFTVLSHIFSALHPSPKSFEAINPHPDSLLQSPTTTLATKDTATKTVLGGDPGRNRPPFGTVKENQGSKVW